MRAFNKSFASLSIDARNEVARLDMPIGLASFCRPRRRGSVRTAFVCHQSWVDGTVSVRGISPDDHALGVLLAVLVLAEQQSETVTLPSRDVPGLVPSAEFVSDNLALDLSCVSFTCRYSDILRLLGVSSRNSVNCAAVWESLQDLSTILVERKTGKYGRALSHLIGSAYTDGKALRIALSYRLAQCVLGLPGSYAAVDLRVFRSLPRGSARILYVWLTSWFAGSFGERSIALDRLVEHVFGDVKRMKACLLRNRRRDIRESFDALSVHGWSFVSRGSLVSVVRVRSVDSALLQTRLRAVADTPPSSVTVGTTGGSGDFESPYKPSVLNRGRGKVKINGTHPPPHPPLGVKRKKGKTQNLASGSVSGRGVQP